MHKVMMFLQFITEYIKLYMLYKMTNTLSKYIIKEY